MLIILALPTASDSNGSVQWLPCTYSALQNSIGWKHQNSDMYNFQNAIICSLWRCASVYNGLRDALRKVLPDCEFLLIVVVDSVTSNAMPLLVRFVMIVEWTMHSPSRMRCSWQYHSVSSSLCSPLLSSLDIYTHVCKCLCGYPILW